MLLGFRDSGPMMLGEVLSKTLSEALSEALRGLLIIVLRELASRVTL